MNTTSTNSIQDIVSKIPITVFFAQLPDRKQVLKYLNWLYDNVPQSKTVNQDQLIREVISRELRMVSMKIVEIEILLIVGLTTITIDDLTRDEDSIINILISQNKDKNDLDVMYRILAQVMTKLPRDLREQVAGKHKLQIFQKIAKFINMEPSLLEKFVSLNPSLNNLVTMELDSGDYNTLNKKYLDEIQKYKASQPYLNSDSMDYLNTSTNVNDMLMKMPTDPNIKDSVKGQYVDTSPDFMVGVNDNKLYYFDSSSGTLSDMPVSNSNNQIPVSAADLATVLSSNKVNRGDIQSLIDSLHAPPTQPATTKPAGYFDRFSSSISSLFNYGSSSMPAEYTPNITVSSSAPIPPQFILSQTVSVSGSGLTSGGSSGGSSGNNNNNNDKTYNTYPYILASPNPNFMTRNNACSIPNPPASCAAKKTSPTFTNDASLEKKFQDRASTYAQSPPITTKQISHFTDKKTDANIEADLIKKITKNNKDIENVALAFVTVIILMFLLVIFNAIRNKNGLVK